MPNILLQQHRKEAIDLTLATLILFALGGILMIPEINVGEINKIGSAICFVFGIIMGVFAIRSIISYKANRLAHKNQKNED